MRARGADPCRFCARWQQLRAAQRSAAGKTPQKSAGLRTTTLHSVAYAAGGLRVCGWARKVELTDSCLCLCSDFGADQGDNAGRESPVVSGGSIKILRSIQDGSEEELSPLPPPFSSWWR